VWRTEPLSAVRVAGFTTVEPLPREIPQDSGAYFTGVEPFKPKTGGLCRMNPYQKTLWLLLFIAAFSLIAHLSPPASCQETALEDKLQTAEGLSLRASEMAAKAKETGDIELLESALERANKASLMVLEVVAATQEKPDPGVAQKAVEVADSIHNTIDQIKGVCSYYAATSTDPKLTADAERISKKANETEALNEKTKQMVLALAETAEKPEQAEPQKQAETQPLRVPPPDTETTEIEAYQREASPSQ